MENKKLWIIIGVIVVVVVAAIGGVIFLLINKDTGKENSDSEEKTTYKKLDMNSCEVTLYIEGAKGDALLTLSDSEEKELFDILKGVEYEENGKIEVRETLLPEYYDVTIKVCDTTISYDGAYSYYILNDKTQMIVKKNKEEIENFVEKKKESIGKVYQEYIDVADTEETMKIQVLTPEDEIIEAWNNNSREVQPIDLDILVTHYVHIDKDVLATDSSFSYAYLNGKYEIIAISDELKNILVGQQHKESPIEGECCSCCPDLKPGESCIAMCCPCS